MNDSPRLAMSYYKTIAVINESHNIFLVQHQETKKIYVKKILDVYNNRIYQYLYENKILGVPQIVSLCEEDNRLTVVEEFISGSSLQEKIDTNGITTALINRYMFELCEILEKLHSVNPPIVHRDIKPSNIMITEYDHVVLLDFNAAKYSSDTDTTDTILLGTRGYAAPEQYGFGSSTPQTDIYSLGILLKELVDALQDPTYQYDEIISTCTQMNPADRFQSISILKQSFQENETPMLTDISKPFTWKSLLPPGFRTLTPWKIGLSSMIYIFIFWLSLNMELDNTTYFVLWLNRIFCLIIMLSIVFCSFNYCNVQRIFPLCGHQNRILRYIGIILLDLIIALFLLTILVIIESSFFG